jgi:hypothetical protein
VRAGVAGFPVFNEGSELLLFLNHDPSNHIALVGLGQGKFNVFIDEATGDKMVANDVLGLELLEGQQLNEAATMRMSLSDMKAAISDELRKTEENKK